MSIEAMKWAMEQTIVTKPTDRHVLLCIANNAREDGTSAFPSISTLTRKTGLSERTVQYAMRRLVECGAMRPGNAAVVAANIKRADQRPACYDLALERGANHDTQRGANDDVERGAPRAPGANEDTNGVQMATNGVQLETERGAPRAPEPSLNHPKEPSIEPNSRVREAESIEPDPRPASTATMAGAVCVALRADGMATVNPSHPKLGALIDRGAGVDAFIGAWRSCRDKARGNAFAYVLAVVDGQMRDAERIAAAPSRTPQRLSASGTQTLANAASLKEKLFKREVCHA